MRSTVTGEKLNGLELHSSYWAKNLREPVLFQDVTQRLIDEDHSVFVEMSPHPILLSSIDEILQEKKHKGLTIASLRRGTEDRRAMLDGAGALYGCGYPLRWTSLSSRGSRCVELPTYPWHRTRG